jgi:hypothetical protein
VGCLAGVLAAAAGCQTNTGDAGCRINGQLVLPPTELTQLRDARLEPVGEDNFMLIGHDDTSIRWAPLGWNTGLGTEQTMPIPAGYRAPIYTLGDAGALGDTLLIGFITDAANGIDAELHLVSVSTAAPDVVPPGPAVVTFAGAAGTVPGVALTASRMTKNAGLIWVDTAEGVLSYIPVDASGTVVGSPVVLDRAFGFDCVGFFAGKGNVSASYKRFVDATSKPDWMISEVDVDAVYMNWSLPLVETSVDMGCAVVTPTPLGYGLAWQDTSGSWLSVHTESNRHIQNHPFASATDFGGPDLQPPIVGLAAFSSGVASTDIVDFGVVFQRVRSVEVWRLDYKGNRRPGALILPSLEGKMGNASSVAVGGRLTVTYADYTPATQTGRRLLVDASCY